MKLLKCLEAMNPNRTFTTDKHVILETFTKTLTSILKGRKALLNHEKRLLGQLAVIAFHETKDAQKIEFLNFLSCQRINLVRLTWHLKQGDEMHNKKLFASRIKTGKKWMQHFPNAFHDELVAELFLEIDKKRATNVL